MPTVGDGVYELRIRAEGAFRVFYVTKRAEGIVVLHAFQKKTQQTAQLDLDLAAKRSGSTSPLSGTAKEIR
jgi:phage-related protein